MAKTIFFILLAILILIILIKLHVLISSKAPGSDPNENCRSGIISFIVFTLDFFSTIYFWYIFFMIGYWWVFFKLQERVYTFVPTPATYWENLVAYDWLFGWVTGSKLLYVFF